MRGEEAMVGRRSKPKKKINFDDLLKKPNRHRHVKDKRDRKARLEIAYFLDGHR